MLKTRIIPCLLFNGFCLVKTIQFGRERTLGNPIQFARVYNSRNVDELIFIDITASQEKRDPVFHLIADIFNECFMPLAVGGGIHTMEHVDRLMRIGADKVIINSEAINNPAFITKIAGKYGSQSVVIAIDVKYDHNEHFVFYNRAEKNTGLKVVDWARQIEALGAGEIFLNSIDKDGTMRGYDLELIKKVVQAVSLPVIACGGAGTIQHVVDAVQKGKADAVSLASLFHFTGETPNRVKEALDRSGVPVRLVTN